MSLKIKFLRNWIFLCFNKGQLAEEMIKQADVVMLGFPLMREMPEDVRRRDLIVRIWFTFFIYSIIVISVAVDSKWFTGFTTGDIMHVSYSIMKTSPLRWDLPWLGACMLLVGLSLVTQQELRNSFIAAISHMWDNHTR